jgi:hypothetical protein
VSSNIVATDHALNGNGATWNFVFAWWDSNNWMAAGYVDGDSNIATSGDPRGYSDWTNGGHYDHTGPLCSPADGSEQDTRVRNTDNGWVATVCGSVANPSPGLGTDHATPEAETEISHGGFGCFGHYKALKDFTTSNDWSLWDSMNTSADNPPMSVNKLSSHEFTTSC